MSIDPRFKKFTFGEKLTYQLHKGISTPLYVLYAGPRYENGSLRGHNIFCPADNHYYYMSISTGPRELLKRDWQEVRFISR